MSALLETTSLPGVYSLAETGTHRQSEIESCQRLAHEVAVIMVGSTGPASRPQNDLHGKALINVFMTGRPKGPVDMVVSAIGEGATGISGDVASQSDLDRVYESRHRAENRRRLREMQALLNWCRSVCVY
jgi:hypothetical protein